MHDKAEVRLVVAHSERRGRYQRLEPVVAQCVLEVVPRGRLELTGVRGHGYGLAVDVADSGSQPFGVSDGEDVDDAGPVEPREMVDDPGVPLHRGQPVDD